MINCEWIRKQKKERPSLGSSPGPKCKPNVRLRVRCANTQQPCFSALCDAWLLRKRDEIRESSYIIYRAILERHIKPRLGSRRLGGICTASVDAFTRELLETDGLSVKTVHDILSVLHSVLKDTEARRPAGALAVQIRYPKGKEAVTGYAWEPWHIRYVSKSLALYLALTGLTLEAREKLARIRPRNLGQAGRIPGVSPSDVAQLSIALAGEQQK